MASMKDLSLEELAELAKPKLVPGQLERPQSLMDRARGERMPGTLRKSFMRGVATEAPFVGAALGAAGEDIGQAARPGALAAQGFAQEALFNVPAAFQRKVGMDKLKPETTFEGFADVLGRGAGLVVGAPAKLAARIGRKVLGRKVGELGASTLKSRFLQTAVPAFLRTSEEEPLDVKGRAKTAAGVGLFSAALPVENIAVAAGRLIKNSTQGLAFQRAFQKMVFKAKKVAGDAFDEDIAKVSGSPENVGKTIDLYEAATQAKTSPALQVAAGGKRRPLLNIVIQDPELARNLTLEDAQALKKEINQIPGIQSKLRQGQRADWTPDDIQVLDFVDDIRAGQIDTFEGLSPVFTKYRDSIRQYNLLKGATREGGFKRGGRPALKESPDIQAAYEAIVPKEVRQQIGSMDSLETAVRFMSRFSWAVPVSGALYLTSHFLGRKIEDTGGADYAR